MQTITVRSEEADDGEPRVFFVVRNEGDRGVNGSAELFPCPSETVSQCTVLQHLTAMPGDSPLPYTKLKSFRFWLHGLDSGPRSYDSLLGALEVCSEIPLFVLGRSTALKGK